MKILSVVTLPISPSANPSIGLAVIPFVMDVISKTIDTKGLLVLNTLGLKLTSDDREANVADYLLNLKRVGIHQEIWRDDNPGNKAYVMKCFHILCEQGLITKESRSIIRCDCGIVESLKSAENTSERRKLYEVQVGGKYCKLCKGKVITSNEVVFLFRFPDITGDIKVFPHFYTKELVTLSRKFCDQKFLISRHRQNDFPIEDEGLFLDTDFVWQLYLPALNDIGYEPRFVVSSGRNLLASIFFVALYKLIVKNTTTLVIPPYFLGPRRQPLKNEKHLLHNLLCGYSERVLRLFMTSAMNWNKKETVLDFTQLSLIAKMAYRIESLPTHVLSLDELFEMFNQQHFKNNLNTIRKGQEVFRLTDLHGII